MAQLAYPEPSLVHKEIGQLGWFHTSAVAQGNTGEGGTIPPGVLHPPPKNFPITFVAWSFPFEKKSVLLITM